MTATTTAFVDLYAVLGVPSTADNEEIRAAIRNQRRVWTKRQGSADAKRRQEAEERVRNIDRAEQVLLDTGRRNQFDADRLTKGSQAPPTPVVEADGHRDWVVTARQHLEAGQAAQANYAAREAINNNGSDPNAWYIRAHSSFLLGNWSDSEYEFNEAIRLRPDEAEYHFDLGSAYEAAKRWADALRKYEDALRIEPGNPMYKIAVASVYLQNGLPERALPIAEEVVAANPDIEAFQFYLAWALADNIASYATVLHDDTFILTTEEQARRAVKDMERASKLRFTEPEMRRYINDRLEWARKAAAVQWDRPSTLWPWIVGALVGLIMLFSGGGATFLGILVLGGIGFLYKWRHNVPGWQIQQRQAKWQSSQVKSWGAGSNR
jgi:tetratricopeptide (TPR) repeat protein